MKYKSIIVDDEPKLRDVLNIKLDQFCPEISVVDKVSNANEAFEAINKHKPDLIFLDIAMPGASGFDLLERFEHIDFEVIFVTGFNEYGLDALKVSAVDYILKPINTDHLKLAVNKAKERIDNKDKIERYDVLKHNINVENGQNVKVAIPGASAFDFVELKDIVHCEGWQKYTKVHLSDGSTIVSSYNLGIFKDMLIPYGFFSTHKSHLINRNHVVKYLKEGELVMSNGTEVPVARRRKEEFLNTIMKIGI